MTAGNNGADTPENDDPFGYLYRSEGGEGATAGSASSGAARQPGVPRTSYNQVRAVGERQYGGQQTQQPPYGRQNAHYAAPETLPGNERTRSAPSQGYDQEPRRGRNGLLIGAVAVVAVVCIGIGVAMFTNSQGKNDTANKPGPTAGDSVAPSKEPSTKPSAGALPKQDAGSLRLDGGAVTAKDVPGARSANGTYVGGMNTPGASATWTVNVDKAGTYALNVDYGVPGKDANLTLTVNGKADPRPISLKNFAGAPAGAWDKGWTQSWSIVNLTQGTNTIKMSCESGNQCDVNLDKVWLTPPK
ncbi:CBM35 domain-containing protein [Streptomyces gilvosporeus]|uniref:Carbohydrate-binding protein n=1 Tax=Streptomyces gilvosporeus TaxID=553510 RepID=A0A1V0TVF3_9ACTN|nr:CBM35 domain-containing protein [Streptomyces gilvosporeus]ARF56897.1 carbohydrate-binding protein [Streptomyces gilvosporeus]